MIKSMTAFGRSHEKSELGEAVWEVRTVNHRYLDLHVNLPEACRDSDMAVREHLRACISRGKVDVLLRFVPAAATTASLSLNVPLVLQLGNAVEELRHHMSIASAMSAIDVLRWPGVLAEFAVDHDALTQWLLTALDVALHSLVAAREREGERLAVCLHAMIDAMTAQVLIAKTRAPVVLQENREKLRVRCEALSVELDPARLEQEVVLMTQRLDVSEECQRLVSHIDEVRAIVKKGGVQGRRLDFLMQELNREANTLGSKSTDVQMTQVSVELKVLIEQMREQVQNIE